MTQKRIHFMHIEQGVPIPMPRDLSPEEQAAILAQAREEFDFAVGEAQYCELLHQRDLGLLVSSDNLLKRLEELVSLAGRDQKESA